MKRERGAFLWDMEQACTAVREFIAGAGQDRYANDLMLRSAVERQLQNIGEALTQLAKLDPELAARVPRHRQLIGFRNVLVHGYAGLNNEEVWRVVHENLPDLHAAVTALRQDADSPPQP